MQKFTLSEIIIGVLSIVNLAGIIALVVLDKPTNVLVPTLGLLIGYLVGRKQNEVLGMIGVGKKIGKKK